ncbi:MAG: NAD-binding protein [Elainellaceae cyanobacterium]
MPSPVDSNPTLSYSHELDCILVCGLGSLGQHCVALLKEFGVRVNAVDLVPPESWEIPTIPQSLNGLWTGDCRRSDILEKAQIQTCRAVLLVTSDERVNIEAAFAARLINPDIRLVVRSSKQNLNQLLEQQLQNFAAFEPTQLSASAFALTALDEEILGFFNIDDQIMHVIQRTIQSSDRWCNVRQVYELNSRRRQVLKHRPASLSGELSNSSSQFYDWNPDAIIRTGDWLITLEASPYLLTKAPSATPDVTRTKSRGLQHIIQHLNWASFKRTFTQFWRQSDRHQIRRVVALCGVTVIALLSLGTLLFWLFYPGTRLPDAFYATVVLLLGGYGDLFSEFELTVPIPWWLRFFGLGLTLAGTAFVGVLYALLTENLLTMRLQFLRRRPPLPPQNHIVVIGLGRVGRRVAALLQEFKQPLIGMMQGTPDPDLLPQIPIISGDLSQAIAQANLSSAKSIIAVTEDEMQNLEMGLMVHDANPHSRIVIRTYDQRFSNYIAGLFSYAQVLCVSALSAEAFVAAAFGENVLSLFRLDHTTVLVTEYRIEADDTLNGLLLSEVAYGYDVVPIYYQKLAQDLPKFMPSDDIRLREGDRLIVLATREGLKRIEQAEMAPRRWNVVIETALTPQASFDGGTEIALISGCRIHDARDCMKDLPKTLPTPLFKHQAKRLVRNLSKIQVLARVKEPSDRPQS